MSELADLLDRFAPISQIDDASTHLLGVINDILDMSKIEAGKFELLESNFEFEKMLQRVTDVMNFRIEEKRQNFIGRKRNGSCRPFQQRQPLLVKPVGFNELLRKLLYLG